LSTRQSDSKGPGTARRLAPNSRLRASPAWQLVLLDRLAAADRAAPGTDLPAETYGLLRPRDPSLLPKAVGPDTALLFLTLQEPARLPEYVRGSFGPEADDAVAELVADGILEAEFEGSWLSGPAAFRPQALHQNFLRAPLPILSVGARSRQALRAAAGMGAESPDLVASFLYRYGTTPILPSRAGLWADSDAIRANFRLDDAGLTPKLSDDSAWWVFPGETSSGQGRPPKLYVGVAVAALQEAIRRVLNLARQRGSATPAFKVGASVHGLHRPDRIVLYPGGVEDAAAWGATLVETLADLPADPVPFTAALNPAGQVSWGADPGPRAGRAWWKDGVSWRSMVTKCLAKALVEACRAGEAEPWTYATERARLAGVDPETWAPLDAGWTL